MGSLAHFAMMIFHYGMSYINAFTFNNDNINPQAVLPERRFHDPASSRMQCRPGRSKLSSLSRLRLRPFGLPL